MKGKRLLNIIYLTIVIKKIVYSKSRYLLNLIEHGSHNQVEKNICIWILACDGIDHWIASLNTLWDYAKILT